MAKLFAGEMAEKVCSDARAGHADRLRGDGDATLGERAHGERQRLPEPAEDRVVGDEAILEDDLR